jgi:outer membrane biosynthesis protein TonB
MADEKPEPVKPEEESKKDTVRINLPPGLTGRASPTGPTSAPPAKPKPVTPPDSPEDEAKRETAVMGKPAVTPKPKSDTSRVQVASAKPAVPETPRPSVKLRREPEAVAGAMAAAGPAAQPAMAAAAPSGAETGLAVAAMILSVAVLAYLAVLAMG